MSQMVKGGPDVADVGDLLAQFRYLTDLIGPDHVACGPDYLPLNARLWENQGAQPFSYVRGVETVADFRNVTRTLVAGGMSDEEIRSILGQSLLSLFGTVRQFRTASPGPHSPAADGFAARTEGTSIETTSAAAKKIEYWLSQQPESKIVTSYIGAGAPRFFFSYNPELPDPSSSLDMFLYCVASLQVCIYFLPLPSHRGCRRRSSDRGPSLLLSGWTPRWPRCVAWRVRGHF